MHSCTLKVSLVPFFSVKCVSADANVVIGHSTPQVNFVHSRGTVVNAAGEQER